MRACDHRVAAARALATIASPPVGRAPAQSSGSSSRFAAGACVSRSGHPVPYTKRSAPSVRNSSARWSSGGPQIHEKSNQSRARSCGRQRPRGLLDELAAGAQHDEVRRRRLPRERAHVRRQRDRPRRRAHAAAAGPRSGPVARARARRPRRPRRARERRVAGPEAPVRRVGAHGGRAAIDGGPQMALPPRPVGTDRRHRQQRRERRERVVQLGVARGRVAPERRRQVRRPSAAAIRSRSSTRASTAGSGCGTWRNG